MVPCPARCARPLVSSGAVRDLYHIHQTAELAERVLLPGDPGRALRLAQTLLREPKMLNHNRGLWGYTGVALADDRLLSIQSTGMGGPSMAIVLSELVELGAKRFVRIGTCGGLVPELQPGQLLVVDHALCRDGTSRALGHTESVAPSAGLLAALLGNRPTASHRGAVVSTDLFYDAEDLTESWVAGGAIAVEMETATLLTLAAKRGVEAASALLVSNTLIGDQLERLAEEELHAAEGELGKLAVSALAESD